ncbi:hypothetical protein LUX57_11025 [Actinomadura madurae]|uniref:hypothetical protein n=1 Tax=Actinomadura madurae TaxID=1993 RepID=UPI0020D23C3E|nr:hypothetical protein [Actinomadura madurae]MCP9965596.1 hypothetical protein [Actinomadura madurae]
MIVSAAGQGRGDDGDLLGVDHADGAGVGGRGRGRPGGCPRGRLGGHLGGHRGGRNI